MSTKFTDQQMALILKRAAEQQAVASEPTHSLESIQEIARQVGIDPRLVADAARVVEAGNSRFSLLGAPSAHDVSRRLGRTTIDRAAVLATIRSQMPLAGEMREVGEGMEWHAGPGDNKTVVAVAPAADATVIRVYARQHGLRAMAFLGGGLAGIMVGVASTGLWGVAGLAVGVTALGASLAGARAVWNRYARRRDDRLRQLCDTLADQLESAPTHTA
jgi:hypothetical protein